MFRILAIGDIVGRPGRKALQTFLPRLRDERQIDFVVANAENAASGTGITAKIYKEIRDYGVDVLTMGDHAYKRRESLPLYEKKQRLLRPANWPSGAPGHGWTVAEGPRGVRVGVIHLQGRVFMNSASDFFEVVDRALEEMKHKADLVVVFMNAQGDFLAEADRQVTALSKKADVIIVDIHAEATSEKIALSWYLDGKVAFLFGSHTHVPTADAIVRPHGTAYITDLGMTGPYSGVIGRIKDAVIKKMRTNVHTPFAVAEGDIRLGAAVAEIDERTGRAVSVEGLWLPLED